MSKKKSFLFSAEKFKQLREAKSLTQLDLEIKTEDLGAKVVERTIGRLENGETQNPNKSTVRVLAEVLGVDPIYLMESEEESTFKSLHVLTEPSRKVKLFDVDTTMHYADLIAYHCSVFAGRDQVLAQVNECISKNEGGYIFIEGLSGFGKTALLAKLTQILPDAAYHFISQSLSGSSELFDPNDEESFLAGLCSQLRDKAKKKGQINVNDLRATYLSLLTEANNEGKATIVIIDAIDELDQNRFFLRGLFPHQLPQNTYIVFSARTIGDRDYLPALGLMISDVSLKIILDRFDCKGVRSLLVKAGGKAALLSEQKVFIKILHEITEGDPFYLRFLVEDIRDGVIGTDNVKDIPRGLNDYLDMQFIQLSKNATSKQQRDILGYILHAKGPLSRSHLISLVQELDAFNFDIAIAGVRRFLLEHKGEFTFCHNRFKQYFENKVDGL